MAQGQAELDAALKALGDLVTSEDSQVNAIIEKVTALIAKLSQGMNMTPVDLTNEVTALNSMVATLTSSKAKLDASIAAATQAGA